MGKLGALGAWKTERTDRLDELSRKVAGDGGATPAQVGVLYVALAAEFQGYCRDLHQECIDDLLDQMAVLPSRLRAAVALILESGRVLDRQNATAVTIAREFKKLDISPWASVQLRNADRYRGWRETLDLVTSVRNATAHSKKGEFEKFVDGNALDRGRWEDRRNQLEQLVVALHEVTAAHLIGVAFNAGEDRSGSNDQ